MSLDRMTSINLPGIFGSGVADWGRKTAAEMIVILRMKAEHDKRIAEAILAAPDEYFQVETYLGVHVRRSREIVQLSILRAEQD
jgi:hypothetical protein